MAKIALVTDLHIGARSDSDHVYKNMKTFYDKVFFPNLIGRNIKTIINLGDTYDRRKFTNSLILDQSRKDIFSKFNEYDCYFIVGNHDSYYSSTIDVTAVRNHLIDYTNIKIVDKPSTMKIEGLNICMIPWITKANEDATVKEIANTKAGICMGHLELTGFEYFKNSICKHGYSPKIFSERFIKTFSGHFHKRSITDTISYLGSPYQTTWQEVEEDKGFHIFDTETFELEFIENPYRLFHMVSYPDIPENIEGSYIKVIVKDLDQRTNDFDIYWNQLTEMKPADLSKKITERVTYNDTVEVTDVENPELEMSNLNLDNLTISKNYIDKLENYDRKEDLKDLIQEIYMESMYVAD